MGEGIYYSLVFMCCMYICVCTCNCNSCVFLYRVGGRDTESWSQRETKDWRRVPTQGNYYMYTSSSVFCHNQVDSPFEYFLYNFNGILYCSGHIECSRRVTCNTLPSVLMLVLENVHLQIMCSCLVIHVSFISV